MIEEFQDAAQPRQVPESLVRAAYRPPRLLRFGAVANLTNAGLSGTEEINGPAPGCAMMGTPTNMMRRPCL